MKATTCKNLRGACDTTIYGETPEEMSKNCQTHVMAMINSGDTAHQEAINDMMSMSKEDQQKWYADFMSSFDSLPDSV